MIKTNKIIVLLSLTLFSALGNAEQMPMAGGMDMKQCMKMEHCKGMMDHSNMDSGMDMKPGMKMEHCKGMMMDHSKMDGGTEMKKQKTKTNNVFE